jgi:predicted lipid-binding transport protein (Tim44 family)
MKAVNTTKRYLFDRVCGAVRMLPCAVCLLLVSAPAMAAETQPSRAGSIVNILLFGVIAYFLVRAFRRRGGGDDRPGPDQTPPRDETAQRPARPMDRHEAARQMWGMLGSKETAADDGGRPAAVRSDGFDEAEFLEGAKIFFSRFQQVGNSRDLEELRGFLSDDVYEHALAKTATEPNMVRTEVMLVDARLMEKRTEAGRTWVTVFYDAQLRKGISGDRPYHVRAAWEFSRDDSVESGLWTLEKINKIDQ